MNRYPHWNELSDIDGELRDTYEKMCEDLDAAYAELRKPDCRTCVSYGAHAGCPLARTGCVDGSMYVARWSEPYPVRLYEKEGKV